MAANGTINLNNPLPADNRILADNRSFCDIGALVSRIGSAVASFFTYIIVKIYEALTWFCQTMDYLITMQCCRAKAEDPAPNPPIPPPIDNDAPPIGIRPPVQNLGQAPVGPEASQIDLTDIRLYGNLDDDSRPLPDPIEYEFRPPVYRPPQNIPFRPALRPVANPFGGFLGGIVDGFIDNFLEVPRPPVQDNGVVYDHMNDNAPEVVAATVKEELPTEAVAEGRRNEALARLAQISDKTSFECPGEIMHFDLDKVLEKYKNDQSPTKFMEWFTYAKADRTRRADFQRILDGFRENPKDAKYIAVRTLVSKLHYILSEKRARVEKLSPAAQVEAGKALRHEIQHIVSRLLDADHNCIDQTLSQLEDVVIEVLATENPLGKDSVKSLLQYKAAHVLFRYRANLIKEILVADPALEDPNRAKHMADIEREVKKRLADAMGMKGKILEAGALFEDLDNVKGQAEAAANRALPIFYEQYKPIEYLVEQSRVVWSTVKGFRTDLIQWATNYYRLEGDDALSKAVAKNQEELANACTVAGAEMTKPGVQLFLEAAGILQNK